MRVDVHIIDMLWYQLKEENGWKDKKSIRWIEVESETEFWKYLLIDSKLISFHKLYAIRRLHLLQRLMGSCIWMLLCCVILSGVSIRFITHATHCCCCMYYTKKEHFSYSYALTRCCCRWSYSPKYPFFFIRRNRTRRYWDVYSKGVIIPRKKIYRKIPLMVETFDFESRNTVMTNIQEDLSNERWPHHKIRWFFMPKVVNFIQDKRRIRFIHFCVCFQYEAFIQESHISSFQLVSYKINFDFRSDFKIYSHQMYE